MDGKTNQTGAIYTNIYGALVDVTTLTYYTIVWCRISTWVNTVASMRSWRCCRWSDPLTCVESVAKDRTRCVRASDKWARDWWWNVRAEGAWMTETTIRMKVKRRDCVAPWRRCSIDLEDSPRTPSSGHARPSSF